MAYQVVTKAPKFNEKNEIVQTTVVIQEAEPYSYITGYIDGDAFSLADSVVIQKTLDDFYNRKFPNRAENEKFDAVDKEIEKMRQVTQDCLTTVNKAVADMTNLVTDVLSSLQQDDEEDTETHENTETTEENKTVESDVPADE